MTIARAGAHGVSWPSTSEKWDSSGDRKWARCGRKMAYDSMAEAETAAAWIAYEKQDEAEMYVYVCNVKRWWPLTHWHVSSSPELARIPKPRLCKGCRLGVTCLKLLKGKERDCVGSFMWWQSLSDEEKALVASR
jgi:hypothetical protein